MCFQNLIRRFGADESGAVTVDWVVLTASIVGVALGIIAVFSEAIVGATGVLTADLGEAMTSAVDLQ